MTITAADKSTRCCTRAHADRHLAAQEGGLEGGWGWGWAVVGRGVHWTAMGVGRVKPVEAGRYVDLYIVALDDKHRIKASMMRRTFYTESSRS
mmetsp:Transcript_41817/g.104395  ORF Transcript_41817/g.104395 Transcript_41817/m.104395 type:complete len:93 (-) Transcript_41817:78-356(-)